jgi:hypothetical protein
MERTLPRENGSPGSEPASSIRDIAQLESLPRRMDRELRDMSTLLAYSFGRTNDTAGSSASEG